MLKRVPLLLAICGALGLSGCSSLSKPETLYQLPAAEFIESAPTSGAARVVLEPVQVADYLNTEVLLQRQVDGSLHASKERWAGRLSGHVTDQFFRQLASALADQQLVQGELSDKLNADAWVNVVISRLDSGPEQPAVLEARWQVKGRNGQLAESRMVRLTETHQKDTADQVRAQGLLLQRLVEQLSSAVKPVALAPKVEAPSKALTPKTVPSRDESPRRPPPLPVRTDVEVFRF